MERTKENSEPLIPSLLKKWNRRKRLTKEQRKELKDLETQAYFNEAKKHAIEKAQEDARENFEQ